jgi:hypothetical protein
MKFRLLGAAFLLATAFASTNATAKPDCPTKHYNGACIQVITYAINPDNGVCCVYPNPCVVPDGWVTSTSGCPAGA